MRLLRPVPLAAALVGFAWTALLFAWPRAVFAVSFDDSFYYFGIARNVVRGLGSTFDGVHPTNGYHPLWMLLCTVPYALGLGGMTAVRVLLAAQAWSMAVALAVLAHVALRAREGAEPPPHAERAAAAFVALLGVTPLVAKLFANGLESGASVLALSGVVAVAEGAGERLLAPDGRRTRLVLGTLLALALLSRTDAALLAPCLVLWALPDLRRAPARTAVALAELLVLPTLVLGAYLASNQLLFGIPMQVSGELKRVTPSAGGLVVVALCLAAPIAILRRLRTAQGDVFVRTTGLVRRTGFFLAFCFALVAYYAALQAFRQLWYFVGPAVYALALLFCAVLDLMAFGLKEAKQRPAQLAVGVALVLACGLGFSLRDALDARTTAMLEADREAGEWIASHVPPGGVLVGSWDAGVIGYFADPRGVVNLDGEVNSPAYLRALKTRSTAAWAEKEPIAWIVNHTLRDEGEARMQALAGECLGDARVRDWTLEHTIPFTYRGASNHLPDGEHEMAVYVYRLAPR
jgi:hypothetical protein